MRENSQTLKMKYEFVKSNGSWEQSYPDLGKYKNGSDCVIRAVQHVTEQPYKKVLSDLCARGVEIGRMPNAHETYRPYLASLGFKEVKLPKGTRMCSDLIPRDRWVLCYVAGHLTAVFGHKLYDTWDCSWTYAYKNGKPINKIVTRIYYKGYWSPPPTITFTK